MDIGIVVDENRAPVAKGKANIELQMIVPSVGIGEMVKAYQATTVRELLFGMRGDGPGATEFLGNRVAEVYAQLYNSLPPKARRGIPTEFELVVPAPEYGN